MFFGLSHLVPVGPHLVFCPPIFMDLIGHLSISCNNTLDPEDGGNMFS
jgi:hypothetical protein